MSRAPSTPARRRRPGVVVLALAAVLALVAASCGGSPAPTAGGAAAPEPVTLMLNWSPNSHHGGIYLARERGWYREAGIDLRIVEPASGGVEAVVGSGEVPYGISVAEAVLPARAAGVPIVSVATILPSNDSSLMALASAGITRPADLAGRTYGGYGGPLETELLAELLRCDGADPATLRTVEVGDVDYLAALQQGRFDVVWVFDGWDVLRARLAGVDVTSIPFDEHLDCIPDWYTPLVITSEGELAERPDRVRRFLAATARGYEAAAADPAAAAAALSNAAPELDRALVDAGAQYYASRFTLPGRPWGTQDRAVWERFEAFLIQAGLLEAPVGVDRAFTNDALAAGGSGTGGPATTPAPPTTAAPAGTGS